MHSFQTLAADLAPLLKKSGDTGDKLKSRRLGYDLDVTTRRGDVSPPDRRVVTSSKLSGDGKSNISQSLREGVTTVISVTTDFEQGRAHRRSSNDLAEWHAILDGQKDSNPVEGLTIERWQTLIADAEGFLAQWGDSALQLSWTDLDQFGIHPVAPAVRFDVIGLVPVIKGGKVATLTERSANILPPGACFWELTSK